MPKRTYRKDLTLPQLAARVSDTENALGSSTDMAALPHTTGFTFDGGAPPDGTLVLVQKVGGTAVQPPGGTQIYEGKAWNCGVVVDAVAFRVPS